MKASPPRVIPAERQRCSGCGHPKGEHHGREACTVPKCLCAEFASPVARKTAANLA